MEIYRGSFFARMSRRRKTEYMPAHNTSNSDCCCIYLKEK